MSRQGALAFRSTVMGRLIATNDHELAERYSYDLRRSALLSQVEAWAFPTYTHDAKASPDFQLPRSIMLRATAEEIVREVAEYNEAYLYYLAETSIPTLLSRDPSFGMRVPELISVLQARIARCEQPATLAACEKILRQLTSNATGGGSPSFEYSW